jgi:hypothetical protein
MLVLAATALHAQDSAMPVPCTKNAPLLPRICDTLDAYAWQYFGLIPSLKDDGSASFEREPGGARLHVVTAQGDTSILLPEADVQLLAEYLDNYEEHTRGYEGGRAPVLDNLEQLRNARKYYPLYQRGILGLRTSGYSERGSVRICTKAGRSLEGALLFATDEALYLSLETEEWNASDGSMHLYRIDRKAILSIALKEHYSYGTGLLFAWLGSVAFVSAMISQSGADGNEYSEAQGLMVLMISLGTGIPLGMLGGILISQIPYEESLTDAQGGAQAASKEALLRHSQSFAHTPPPELRMLFSDSEKQRLTRNEYPGIPPSPQPRAEVTASMSADGAQSSPVRRPQLHVAAEYGINMYQNNNSAPRPNDADDKSWSNKARHVGIWLGLSLRYSYPVVMLNANGACIALRPQAGFGMNNVRAGLDVMFQFGNLLYPDGTAFLTAGLDVQRIHEEFGFFGRYAGPYSNPGNYFRYHDVLEQSTLRQLLFASVGIGWEYTSTMFELQYRYSLGKPLYTVGEAENYLIDPLSPPGNERNFPALLFRLSWKLL